MLPETEKIHIRKSPERTDELVENFRDIARVAVRRVKHQEPSGVSKMTTLYYERGMRIYRVTVTPDRRTWWQRIAPRFSAPLTVSIRGYQLDRQTVPTQELIPVELPTDTGKVTLDALPTYQDADPERVRKLGHELLFGKSVHPSFFDITEELYADLVADQLKAAEGGDTHGR